MHKPGPSTCCPWCRQEIGPYERRSTLGTYEYHATCALELRVQELEEKVEQLSAAVAA